MEVNKEKFTAIVKALEEFSLLGFIKNYNENSKKTLLKIWSENLKDLSAEQIKYTHKKTIKEFSGYQLDIAKFREFSTSYIEEEAESDITPGRYTMPDHVKRNLKNLPLKIRSAK